MSGSYGKRKRSGDSFGALRPARKRARLAVERTKRRKHRKYPLSSRSGKVRVPPNLKQQIRSVVCQDGELKGTSFQSYYSDIVTPATDSWSRELNGATVNPGGYTANITLLGYSTTAASPMLQDANWASYPTKKVVVGDSLLKNREGSIIYPRRIDLLFNPDFNRSSTFQKAEWMKVRVWIVQQKANTDSTAVPTFSMWQAESAANQIGHDWADKTLTWFDPRKKIGAVGASQFRVLKKVLYTFKADTVQKYLNIPFSDTTPLFNPAGPSTKSVFKSISLDKKGTGPIKYTVDTSGDPNSGNLFLMVQAWSSVDNLNRAENPVLSLFSRLMYAENPCM